MAKHDEVNILRSLGRNKEVSVNQSNKTIYVSKDAQSVGNGTWGKIDYLVHYCGYTQGFSSGKVVKTGINADAKVIVSKKEKQETKKAAKLKRAKYVKQVFKKKLYKVK